MTDKIIIEEMGNISYQIVQSYSSELMAKQYQSLYEQMITK